MKLCRVLPKGHGLSKTEIAYAVASAPDAHGDHYVGVARGTAAIIHVIIRVDALAKRIVSIDRDVETARGKLRFSESDFVQFAQQRARRASDTGREQAARGLGRAPVLKMSDRVAPGNHIAHG